MICQMQSCIFELKTIGNKNNINCDLQQTFANHKSLEGWTLSAIFSFFLTNTQI